MRVISLINQKGGTGKTNLVTSLAVHAQEQGDRVLILDLDPQLNSLEWGQERESLELGPPIVEAFPLAKLSQLSAMVRGLKDFDTVFIDTPGVESTAAHWAMAAANLCLVPITPSKADVRATRPTLAALARGDTDFAIIMSKVETNVAKARSDEMATGLSAAGTLALPFIHHLMDYKDAYGSAKGATEYSPKGQAASEIRQLWQWIKKHKLDKHK